MAGPEALIALLAVGAAQTMPDASVRSLVERQAERLERQSRVIEALEARVRSLEDAQWTTASLIPERAVPATETPAISNAPQSARLATATAASRVGRFPDDAVVRTGTFDRALTIPGTDLSLRLGGFVQGDFTLDDGRGQPGDGFTASSIAPGGRVQTRSRVNARNSRFNIDARSNSALGPFRVFIEGDFAGAGGSEVTSNGSAFRLRHAFGQFGSLYVGQYWSAFVDLDAFPETLDVASPAGKSAVRQAGIRYVAHVDKRWTAAVAVENPELDAPLATGQASEESVPDVHAYVTYSANWGHVKLAGVARRLAIERGGSALGWGANLTGRIAVPVLSPHDNIVFGVIGGQGVGRYVLEFGGSGLDAEVDGQSDVSPVRTLGGYLGVQHWWSDKMRSTVTAGLLTLERAKLSLVQPMLLSTQSANLLWNPIPPVTLGIELLNGLRENANGFSATVRRMQLTSRYAF